ncbi:tetratricopeptide repeat protein [Allobacillus sp. SKP2-8]|uniref:tetratricopeptide repeat protein n=1 Tax=unclassified Allobacillus TaxID=2628859 RepID=UPI001182BE1B|nr:tetratricopeptide repeat protein [Allobacillus sp. SKP2-8]TSJ65764.1 tetratricopeptide repeat protein [Allobacillus sp. SKP2-8]
MDIFDIDAQLEPLFTETNKEDLEDIKDEFKKANFRSLLTKIEPLQEKYEDNAELVTVLSLIHAISYSQVGEQKQGAEIIKGLYEELEQPTIDDLMLYSHLAYLNDYKLSRRIMSDAVKKFDDEEDVDHNKKSQAYLLLAEAEEKLQKFGRAIKYYSIALEQLDPNHEEEYDLVLYQMIKLGNLHSIKKQNDDAVHYFKQVVELANEEFIQYKIDSLISLGKIASTKNEYDDAVSYLDEAITLLEKSSIQDKSIFIEAYVEMAYTYFIQSKWGEAVPFYEKAMKKLRQLVTYPKRDYGMVLMQYAYSLENKDHPDQKAAGKTYEQAIDVLEEVNEPQLLESALGDTIKFFDKTNQQKKKQHYEEKFVQLTNERSLHNHIH